MPPGGSPLDYPFIFRSLPGASDKTIAGNFFIINFSRTLFLILDTNVGCVLRTTIAPGKVQAGRALRTTRCRYYFKVAKRELGGQKVPKPELGNQEPDYFLFRPISQQAFAGQLQDHPPLAQERLGLDYVVY